MGGVGDLAAAPALLRWVAQGIGRCRGRVHGYLTRTAQYGRSSLTLGLRRVAPSPDVTLSIVSSGKGRAETHDSVMHTRRAVHRDGEAR